MLRVTKSRHATLVLSALAGLAFGGTGLASRIISLHTIMQPLVLSLLGYGALGMLFLAAALQRDTVNRVNSVLFSSELAIPSLLGILFLHDGARHGAWPIMIAGFGSVIVGTVIIAFDTKTTH
jgi:hypothetical protein